MSFKFLQAKFQGRDVAVSYFNLWLRTSILRRRIDSFQVVDRAIIERRRTYDVDLSALRGMTVLDRNLGKVHIEESPASGKVIIPVMKVPKGLFSNVDTESGSGQALHLCRKHINVQVVAHIVVGICVTCGMASDGDEPIFNSAIQHLYSGPPNGIQVIQKLALNHGIQTTEILDFFLDDLQTLYIQCVEIDLGDSGSEIIKIRSAMANDAPERGGLALRLKARTDSQLKGAELPKAGSKTLTIFTSARQFFQSKAPILVRSFISTALDLAGIKATRLIIKYPPVGEGVHPTHMRIISPAGTLIDDVNIIRGRPYGTTFEQRP